LTASGSVRNRVRRILLGWPLHAALSLALIFWLVSDLDWTTVKRTLLAADRLLVAAAFAVLAPIPLLAAERWRRASAALGIELSRRFFVRATYAALFAGQFLPAGVGPDAVRFTLLWRQRVVLGGAIQSIAIDRICGVGALLVWCMPDCHLPWTCCRRARRWRSPQPARCWSSASGRCGSSIVGRFPPRGVAGASAGSCR
jgi:uncharacterized membrane protein YbhN (UPF0104 family)